MTKVVGHLASYWNIPIITWVSLDPFLSDSKLYPTLSRTMGSYNKLGLALVTVFRYIGWRQVSIQNSTRYFVNNCRTAWNIKIRRISFLWPNVILPTYHAKSVTFAKILCIEKSQGCLSRFQINLRWWNAEFIKLFISS